MSMFFTDAFRSPFSKVGWPRNYSRPLGNPAWVPGMDGQQTTLQALLLLMMMRDGQPGCTPRTGWPGFFRTNERERAQKGGESSLFE